MRARRKACKVKSATLRYGQSERHCAQSAHSLLACAHLQLVRLSYLTDRTQKDGVIGHDNVVILGWLFRHFLPRFQRGLIKLCGFIVIISRVTDDAMVTS